MYKQCCAIIASSPLSFRWGYDEDDEYCFNIKRILSAQLERLLEKPIKRFAVVMDNGFGLYAAEAVIALQETNPGLELYCYVPHEEQATQWTPLQRGRYFRALELSSRVITLHPREKDCARKAAMLDAVGTASTVVIVLATQHDSDMDYLIPEFIKRLKMDFLVIDEDAFIHELVSN